MSTAVFAQNDAASIYKSKCAVCHGADGNGATGIGHMDGTRNFHAQLVANESDKVWFDITKDGKNKMPAYGASLSNDQIHDLVKFIRTLK